MSLVERDQGTRVAAELLSKLGIQKTQVRELQNLPLDRLMAAYFATVRAMNVDQMTLGFSPTVNGRSVPTHPFHPVASAVSAGVPLLIGSTRTELTSQTDPAAFALDEAGMRGRIQVLLGASADGIVELYRKLNPAATPSDLYFPTIGTARR